LEVLVDLVVPESQYTIARILQEAIAQTITLCVAVRVVLTAIELDNEPVLRAGKVDDMTPLRVLPAKMKAALSP